MPPRELQHLLRVLEDRNIDIGHDDVAWAFESSKTHDSMTGWVNKYLTPSNVLTTEELAFSKTHAGRKPKVQDPYSRPISDTEFETAIKQLEASTAAIETQSRLLEKQKEALQAIQASNAPRERSETSKSIRQKRLERERARVEDETSALADSMQARLQASIKQSKNAVDGLPSATQRILEKDDRLLDGLDKILPQASGLGGSATDADEINVLCQALINLSAAEIRSKIDQVYTTTVQAKSQEPEPEPESETTEPSSPKTNSTSKSTSPSSSTKQLKSLRAELAELTREITSLATMAVESRYQTPISRALSSAKTDVEAQSAAWTAYATSALDYMTARCDLLADHVLGVHAHLHALGGVGVALEGVLAAASPSTGNGTESRNGESVASMAASTSGRSRGDSTSTSISASTATTTASSAATSGTDTAAARKPGLRLLRLVQANLSETHNATAQLLRHFDVRLSGADMSDMSRFSATLASTVQQRKKKIAAQAKNTDDAVLGLLVNSSGRSEGDVGALERALWAYSPFGEVCLVDEETAQAVRELEMKTDEVSEEMRGLDLEGIAAAVKKAKGSLLVEK